MVMVAGPAARQHAGLARKPRRRPVQHPGPGHEARLVNLDGLGYAEPDGEVYTTVGGDPMLFGWTHTGFDDQVPTTSPYLDGAANNVYPSFHGRLLRNDGVIELITATLRAAVKKIEF